jgi:hypothetical protein
MIPRPQRRLNSNDLLIVDVQQHIGLGGLFAGDRHDNIKVDDPSGQGE